MNAREELRERLYMVLAKNQVKDAIMEIDAILGEFEIQNRITEIALLQEDRKRVSVQKISDSKDSERMLGQNNQILSKATAIYF